MSASAHTVLLLAVAGLWMGVLSPAQAASAPNAQAASPAAGAPVAPLTVRPQTEPKGKVVASTAAAPMTSPDFTAEDARDPPLAVRIGPNTALGRQTPETSVPAGMLKTNPDLPGGYRTRDVGVTTVF